MQTPTLALTTQERIALRMIVRVGPLTPTQLRRLFGLRWQDMMMSLERRGLLYFDAGTKQYDATDQGVQQAA